MVKKKQHDMHLIRYFGSFVLVSDGKVIRVTEPQLAYCPLADMLHTQLRSAAQLDTQAIKQAVCATIEEKIKKFGFFTAQRILTSQEPVVSFGASEIVMYALQDRAIDCAVIVCDGAGTVVTNRADVVQGIGGNMNSLFATTPILEVAKNLRRLGGYVVSPLAKIDQLKGVQEAAALGFHRVAVTVNGRTNEDLAALRKAADRRRIDLIMLVVCTTGVSRQRAQEICEHADLVWSCASVEILQRAGKLARLQLSERIPVFALTDQGVDLVAACSDQRDFLKKIGPKKQYLIARHPPGEKIKLFGMDLWLRPEPLPTSSAKRPRLSKDTAFKIS